MPQNLAWGGESPGKSDAVDVVTTNSFCANESELFAYKTEKNNLKSARGWWQGSMLLMSLFLVLQYQPYQMGRESP